MSQKNKIILCAAILIAGTFTSCKRYDNFTTYFNTYYNANRLLNESVEEFEYQDEKKRLNPRILVPEYKISASEIKKQGSPSFLQEFIVTKAKRQPVNVKLDSIIIKGTKILTYHPNSEYVEKTLFLMARAHFYKEEWLPAQIKCSELIDKFPDGDLSPDAHLLLSINLMVQQKFFAGKVMLSRTVDIAWQKKRYDILSEAFRLEAELALYEDDLEGALKPYLQAIAEAEDDEMRAKWQVDLGALLYRVGKYERAEKEFTKVENYSPDYLAIFEGRLYRAASLIRIGKSGQANKILTDLENDGKFEEWKAYVFSQKMLIALKDNDANQMIANEKKADSVYANHPAFSAYFFERGMEAFKKNEYINARALFAKSRNMKTYYFELANKMFLNLNTWEGLNTKIKAKNQVFDSGVLPSDSSLAEYASYNFEMGRTHTYLGNPDSVNLYYKVAVDKAPSNFPAKAKYLYAYSRLIKDSNPKASDSLLDIVATQYSLTEYGKEAMTELGYTKAFIRDTAADLYTSGYDLMKFGEYNFAISQFIKVYSDFPKTTYAPRSLYSIGRIYERNKPNFDSALYFYNILLDKYPESEYAKDIKLSVLYKNAVASGKIPDSLKTAPTIVYKPKPMPPAEVKKAPTIKKAPEQGNGIKDLMDPGKMLQKAGEMLMSPIKENSLDDPSKLIKNLKDSTMKEINDIKNLDPTKKK